MFNLELDVEVLLKKKKEISYHFMQFQVGCKCDGHWHRHPIGLRNIWCAKLPLSRSHFCVGAQNVNKKNRTQMRQPYLS